MTTKRNVLPIFAWLFLCVASEINTATSFAMYPAPR